MYSYPATLTKDEGTLLVRFRDVPEAISYGATREEALGHAKHALETALEFYIDGGKPLPRASASRRGEVAVAVGAQANMKLALYDAYRVAGVTKSELSRRMGIPKTNVDRLFSLTHASRVELIESAAAALGKRLVIALRNMAALLAMSFPLLGQLSQTLERPCSEAWRAGVESYGNVGLTVRQLDKEGGVALLRPSGGMIQGYGMVSDFAKKYARGGVGNANQLFADVSLTFSPRDEGKACRVWVSADFTLGGGGLRTPLASNNRLEEAILTGIRRAIE